MLAINGVKEFVASSSAFGITTFKDPKNYGLSLTLGGGEVKMIEMAAAFSSFANRGVVKDLNPILKIEDKFGKTLFKFESPNFIADIKNLLTIPAFFQFQVKSQFQRKLPLLFLIFYWIIMPARPLLENRHFDRPGHAVSVKTGTTDDKRDNWTIGYTPNFMTTVWVGNNDNTPMNPYLIWYYWCRSNLESGNENYFEKPTGPLANSAGNSDW